MTNRALIRFTRTPSMASKPNTRAVQRHLQFVALLALASVQLSGTLQSEEIRVESALLTLLEQAEISAREAGPLIHREISEGVTVESDTVLGKVDDQEARLVLDRAVTELKMAQALVENDIKLRFARKSLEVAQAELRRSQESVDKFPKSVSQTELDRLRLLADKAQLEIEQAAVDHEQAVLTHQLKQHDVDRAKLSLERRLIKAPFPGVLVQWKKQRGEWVEPGTPLVRMIRLNRLRAEAFVSAKLSPSDLIGRSVTLIVDPAEKLKKSKFEGRLVFVDPEVDPATNQMRVWAEIDNTELILRPGQSAVLVLHSIKAGE